MNLDALTPAQLRTLAEQATSKADAIEQAEEEALHARKGCKLAYGHTINYCTTCGRDEDQLKDCPHGRAD